MEKEIQKLSNKQGKEFTAVEDIICARLDEDGSFLKPIARILNCESWGESTEEDNDSNCDFADTDIKKLLHNFNKLLESAGVNISETEFLEEWNDLIRYTKTYLIPAKSSYLKTWRRIFNSSRAKTDFKNVLLLVEICFVTALSNAQLERPFSRMKRVKSKTRCNLSNTRLENLLRIGQEGEELATSTIVPAMKLWENEKNRRPHQTKK